jgi:hypothetical protein
LCPRPSRVKRCRAGQMAAPRIAVRGQALDRRCARWRCDPWPERRNGPCSDRTKE